MDWKVWKIRRETIRHALRTIRIAIATEGCIVGKRLRLEKVLARNCIATRTTKHRQTILLKAARWHQKWNIRATFSRNKDKKLGCNPHWKCFDRQNKLARKRIKSLIVKFTSTTPSWRWSASKMWFINLKERKASSGPVQQWRSRAKTIFGTSYVGKWDEAGSRN